MYDKMITLILSACFFLSTSATESAGDAFYLVKFGRDDTEVTEPLNDDDLLLEYETVARIASLPLHCHRVQYPNKLQQTLTSDSELLPPSGCSIILHSF